MSRRDIRIHHRVARPGVLAVVALALLAIAGAGQADPLASWKAGSTKARIVNFVEQAADPASRVAVFDNDGTLWSEQPMYFQLAFVIDRVRELAPSHPEWKTTQPFKAALEGDVHALAAGGEHALLELVMATHAGMSTDEFQSIVRDWLAKARHPKTGRPYTEMVFKPQLELLAYLRRNGFKVYIVSGGGIEFLRAFSEEVYGVPRENVVGSSVETRYEIVDGQPVLMRLPKINFIDDKAGKPVGINQHIGRRPVLAFGNSDGDFEMLEWTTAGSGPRLGLIVHHDDGVREYAYDRKSAMGSLDRGLDEAAKRGWALVSMKDDWSQVYPEPESRN